MSRHDTRGGDLPLIAWGEELRRSRLERSRTRRRWFAFTVPIVATVTVSIALPVQPRLIWNATSSAPIGLYVVTLGKALRRGDMVVAHVPLRVRPLAASRHYLPLTVPLVKHVGGVPGDAVCAVGAIVTIDGRPAAIRREADGAGRPMPWWRGCRRLHPGEVFLLSADAPTSFDGRYFGVSAATDIIGSARLIWSR